MQPDALKLFEARFGNGFSKTYGRLILDSSLPDLAKTICSFIGLVSWKDPIGLSYAEIAACVNCSRRAAVSNCQLLEEKGYIVVRHRRRMPNLYSLPPSGWVNPKQGNVEVRETFRCPRCGQQRRQILNVGWCRPCNDDIRMRRTSAETTYQILRLENLA